MTTNDPKFQAAMFKFLTGAQLMIEEHYAKTASNLEPDYLTVDPGSRYVRVVANRGDEVSRRVHCFVDRKSGAILKAASWRTPAKHARGNIFDADPTRAVTWTGARYL